MPYDLKLKPMVSACIRELEYSQMLQLTDQMYNIDTIISLTIKNTQNIFIWKLFNLAETIQFNRIIFILLQIF